MKDHLDEHSDQTEHMVEKLTKLGIRCLLDTISSSYNIQSIFFNSSLTMTQLMPAKDAQLSSTAMASGRDLK